MPEGHPGHPRGRAARHPDPALLRPPAARPGRRLPPVHRRGRGPAQAARLCTTDRDRRHGRQDAADLAGRREGAGAATSSSCCINHPLDCPVCDKGGECPLQNQTMSNGYGESRFRDEKRTFPKPIAISSQVLLDRERCVLCARCTRFSQQIAGDPFIELFERGALEQVAIYTDEPFHSYFSGNTVQICPVGALTGAHYRFRARPFDLVSTPSVCEHCASGCRSAPTGAAARCCAASPATTPTVNEEWNCDKGRWAFQYATRQGPPDHAAGPRRRRRPASRRRGPRHSSAPPRAWPRTARQGRRADRWPAHGRGRLRLREVRPGRARHQRHRLPGPAALGRGARLPCRPRRRPLPRDDVRRHRGRARRAARRVRAGGGVADRLPAAAQGVRKQRHAGLRASRRSRRRGLRKIAARRCSQPCPGAEARGARRAASGDRSTSSAPLRRGARRPAP